MSSPFFAKLLVLDQQSSVSFYEALGFVRVGADGTFVHLRWEAHGDVMLVGAPTGVQVGGKRGWGVLLCFASQTSLDELKARAEKLSAPVEGPDTKPWHTRELVVTDPDGYRLNFLQPVESPQA